MFEAVFALGLFVGFPILNIVLMMFGVVEGGLVGVLSWGIFVFALLAPRR